MSRLYNSYLASVMLHDMMGPASGKHYAVQGDSKMAPPAVTYIDVNIILLCLGNIFHHICDVSVYPHNECWN